MGTPYAVCPGGEGAVLKTVGLKGLAGSNPVHGAKVKVKEVIMKPHPYLVKEVKYRRLYEICSLTGKSFKAWFYKKLYYHYKKKYERQLGV